MEQEKYKKLFDDINNQQSNVVSQQRFIQILNHLDIDFEIDGDTINITDYNGDIDIPINKLTNNVIFNNIGYVHLKIKELPDNIIFKNGGNITFINLVKFSSSNDKYIFYNKGSIYFNELIEFNRNIEFYNSGDVWFSKLLKLNEKIQFKNGRDLFFNSLIKIDFKNLKENYIFNNKGSIYFHKLKIIRSEKYSIKFKNGKDINFNKIIKFSPFILLFENQGDVQLNNLKHIHKYFFFNNKGVIYLKSFESLDREFIKTNKHKTIYISNYLYTSIFGVSVKLSLYWLNFFNIEFS